MEKSEKIEKKPKKVITTAQLKKRYRAIQYSAFAGQFVSTVAPFGILAIVNADEWFYVENGWTVGIGFTLALALTTIATFLVSKKKEDSTITNGFITLIVGWFAVAFIFILLANIMDQIANIMIYVGLGLLGALGLNITSNTFKKKAEMIKDAQKEVDKERLKKKISKEIDESEGLL